MKRSSPWLLAMFLPVLMAESCENQRLQERLAVDRQQQIYLTGQPVPAYDYSLERDRVIGLYDARMNAAQTWTVWRSMTGTIEGDCPSSGYPLPYGVQLTSPEAYAVGGSPSPLPQAEPNGLFTNGITTEATWVFCISETGKITPVYVETKVTVYPYPVTVDYGLNTVTKNGRSSVVLKK